MNKLEYHQLANLFPLVHGQELDDLVHDIKENGLTNPVTLYEGKILDGRNRYRACLLAGVEPELIDFNGTNPLNYVISQNLYRRNLNPSQLALIASEIATLKRGRPRDDVIRNNQISLPEAAKIVGTNTGIIGQIRRIKNDGNEDLYESIRSGETRAGTAISQIQEHQEFGDFFQDIEDKKKPTKKVSTFNYTNENIEWAKWTWNPVVGCRFNCKYCYAHDIAMRFYGTFEPTFREERLKAPYNTTIPKNQLNELGIRNVFVCSMADLFGDWIPKEQIQQVLDVCKVTPQWTYIFLTKNPKRYSEFSFSENSWVGATIDTQDRVESTYQGLLECDAKVRFISFEPLKGPIELPEDMPIDWIIIGGQRGSNREPAGQPKWAWVEDLTNQARKLGVKVYWKPNLTVRPKEYPVEEISKNYKLFI
jgi:protein gp37